MRIATVVSRAQSLCGVCYWCKSADIWTRIREYIANLDEGESEKTWEAVSWIRDGYPHCPESKLDAQSHST